MFDIGGVQLGVYDFVEVSTYYNSVSGIVLDFLDYRFVKGPLSDIWSVYIYNNKVLIIERGR